MEEKVRQLGEVVGTLTRDEVFQVGPIPITSTVVNTWIVMVVMFAVLYLLTRRLGDKPKGAQTLLEMAVGFFYSLIDDSMGKAGRKFLPIVGTLFIYILFLNLSWFIPNFTPPTTDVMTTAALAITTILLVQLMGIREKGFGGYLRNFAQPLPMMLPLNIIEEIVKPLSLAIRLFGNMFGEKMVVTIFFILVPLVAPIPLMGLGILMGAIQAFIFTLLTVTYLATATQGH